MKLICRFVVWYVIVYVYSCVLCIYLAARQNACYFIRDDTNTKYSTPDWHKINDNLNNNIDIVYRYMPYIHLEISSQFCGIDLRARFGLENSTPSVMLYSFFASEKRGTNQKNCDWQLWHWNIVVVKLSGGNGSLIKWQMTNKLHIVI